MKRLWHNLFPTELAVSLAREFGFNKTFPLSERLSEAVYWLRHRTGRFSSAEARVTAYRGDLERAMESGKIESMAAAITVGLWRKRNQRGIAGRAEEGIVRLAIREELVKERRSGRAEDWARQSFFRTLGAIYEDGTKRNPSISGTSGQFRGKGYRFAQAVADWVNAQQDGPQVSVHRSALDCLQYRKRNRQKPKIRKVMPRIWLFR
jgi:hypothetical protein